MYIFRKYVLIAVLIGTGVTSVGVGALMLANAQRAPQSSGLPVSCTVAGIDQPFFSTTLKDGFDAPPEFDPIVLTYGAGTITPKWPGLELVSDQNSQAALRFRGAGNADKLAVHLINREIYQILQVTELADASWSGALSASGLIGGLHVDSHETPNAWTVSIMPDGSPVLGDRFALPDNTEMIVVVDLGQAQVTAYSVRGRVLAGPVAIPADMGHAYAASGPRYWIIGDAWQDNIYRTKLMIHDVCFSGGGAVVAQIPSPTPTVAPLIPSQTPQPPAASLPLSCTLAGIGSPTFSADLTNGGSLPSVYGLQTVTSGNGTGGYDDRGLSLSLIRNRPPISSLKRLGGWMSSPCI